MKKNIVVMCISGDGIHQEILLVGAAASPRNSERLKNRTCTPTSPEMREGEGSNHRDSSSKFLSFIV